jgi:hypothetical protein
MSADDDTRIPVPHGLARSKVKGGFRCRQSTGGLGTRHRRPDTARPAPNLVGQNARRTPPPGSRSCMTAEDPSRSATRPGAGCSSPRIAACRVHDVGRSLINRRAGPPAASGRRSGRRSSLTRPRRFVRRKGQILEATPLRLTFLPLGCDETADIQSRLDRRRQNPSTRTPGRSRSMSLTSQLKRTIARLLNRSGRPTRRPDVDRSERGCGDGDASRRNPAEVSELTTDRSPGSRIFI